MRTTIDQHMGIHTSTGLVMRSLYEVVTEEYLYPDAATARAAHAAQVELQSLDQDDRQVALVLLATEDCDPEDEASVIRRCIAEAVGCCPYCSSQGQVTRREDGPDAQEVTLDVGNTEPLRGFLCRDCRLEVGGELSGIAPHEPERDIKILRIVSAEQWGLVSEEWNPNEIGTDDYDTPRAAALYEALGVSKDDDDYSLCSNSKGLWALIGTTQSGDRYAVESKGK